MPRATRELFRRHRRKLLEYPGEAVSEQVLFRHAAERPGRQWLRSLQFPLRPRLATQPELVTPVLQLVHREIARHLLGQADLKADEAESANELRMARQQLRSAS